MVEGERMRKELNPILNEPQAAFLSMPHKYKSFVAGYGSGKTWVGCSAMAKHFWEHPGVNAGYFAPTYPQIRDIFYPTIAECFEQWGLSVDVKQSAHEVFVYSGRFNPRTRVGCDDALPQTFGLCMMFQSTHPRGVRLRGR